MEYGQNGKVSPEVHTMRQLGTVTDCRTSRYPRAPTLSARSSSFLQSDLAAGAREAILDITEI